MVGIFFPNQIPKGMLMSVAKNVEITSSSSKSFSDAVEQGISRASKTIHNIRGAWIKEQKVAVNENKITEYRVTMILTFVLNGD
jgi:flavin-binding protein dodecin